MGYTWGVNFDTGVSSFREDRFELASENNLHLFALFHKGFYTNLLKTSVGG
jgi:hypothetical protein